MWRCYVDSCFAMPNCCEPIKEQWTWCRENCLSSSMSAKMNWQDDCIKHRATQIACLPATKITTCTGNHSFPQHCMVEKLCSWKEEKKSCWKKGTGERCTWQKVRARKIWNVWHRNIAMGIEVDKVWTEALGNLVYFVKTRNLSKLQMDKTWKWSTLPSDMFHRS